MRENNTITRKKNVKRNAAIISEIKSGKRYSELVGKYKLSYKGIAKIAERAGLRYSNSAAKKKIEARNIQIISAIKRGERFSELAHKHKLAYPTLAQMARNAGLSYPNFDYRKRIETRNSIIIKDFEQAINANKEKRRAIIMKIAKKYSLSYNGLYGMLWKKGELKNSYKEIMAIRDKEIATKFKQGLSCKQIAVLFNLSFANTQLILHKQNLFYFLSASEYAKRNALIITALKSGKTHRQIAIQFQISGSRVSQILKNYNQAT